MQILKQISIHNYDDVFLWFVGNKLNKIGSIWKLKEGTPLSYSGIHHDIIIRKMQDFIF